MENEVEYIIDIDDLSKPMYIFLGVGVFLLIIHFIFIGKISLVSNFIHSDSIFIYFLLFLIAIVISCVIHEILHALTFLILTKSSFSCIKFGLYKGNPYCHCSCKIKVKHYKIVLLTPLILLGLILYFLGLHSNESFLVLIGIFNIISAVGDICVYNLLKTLPKESYIKDHPSKIGFFLYETKSP